MREYHSNFSSKKDEKYNDTNLMHLTKQLSERIRAGSNNSNKKINSNRKVYNTD